MKRIVDYLKHPSNIFLGLDRKKLLKLNDEIFLKLSYKDMTNKKLDLKKPKSFNEKLQWLKLHDRKDIYTTMVDKYEVKNYVSNIIDKEYIIPTIGVYDKFDDIDFNKLPNQFIMKCTHDSGGLVICKKKTIFDITSAKKKINKSLKRNFYYVGREWPYKNVKPKIIVEKYMGNDLNDYKLFCFNGKPQFTLVCSERFNSNGMCKSFYDNDWNLMNIKEGNHNNDNNIKKPINFEKMKELAEKLSANIPFLRVDFYEIDNKIYFGELTFYPNGGYEKFDPEEWDYKIGNLINLEGVRNNEKGKSNKKH